MTYNVFSGTLNPSQSILFLLLLSLRLYISYVLLFLGDRGK